MQKAKPYEWIKKIDTALVDLEKVPQFSLPSAFPLEDVEKKLRTLFKNASLKLSLNQKGWIPSQSVLEGMDEKTRTLKLVWSPLPAPLYFIMSEHNINVLMGELFGEKEIASSFVDEEYVEGFYHYLLLEVLSQIESTHFASPLTLRLGGFIEDFPIDAEPSTFFVCDISVQSGERSLWGRLLLSQDFRKAWESYFSTKPAQPISNHRRAQIPLDIGLEVGRAKLKLQEWKKAKTGDLIILDHCSYSPAEKKGSLLLTLGEKIVFRGRFKEHGIKLTEYPFYDEVENNMEDEEFESEEEEGEEEDDDLYGDLEEDFEENDLFGKSPENEEEEEEEKEVTRLASEEIDTGISMGELPIKLTIEVGRIRMTAQELIDLAPGNLLKLDVKPEQGVDLVINGKRVGKGELIQVGEMLGVRILNL